MFDDRVIVIDKEKGTVPIGTVPVVSTNFFKKIQSLIKYQKKEKFWSSPFFYAFINLSELNIHSSDTPTSAKIARNIVATPNAPKIKIIIFKIKASPIFS